MWREDETAGQKQSDRYSHGLLSEEATSTDRVASLQIYNADTGAFTGTIPLVDSGKFVSQLHLWGTFTSLAAQSTVAGLSIAALAQK